VIKPDAIKPDAIKPDAIKLATNELELPWERQTVED
jgi:hypothetical protein